MAETEASKITTQSTATPSQEDSQQITHNVLQSKAHDEALDFLERYRNQIDGNLGSDMAYLRGLRRKIDLRILPFMLLIYTFNFIDKTILNYSNVMGLSQDLNLVGNEYSNASSAFWAANLVGAVINVCLIQRFPTGKWLGICLAIWSISTACTAAVQNYGGLLATRIISGAVESTVPPAMMLLTSQYYTKAEQASRFSTWYLGIGFGQILGGLISWGFQNAAGHTVIADWRVMFLVLGIVTLTFSCFILVLLPDTPMQAWFLSNDEKYTVLEHIKSNQTGVEGKAFIPRQLMEAITDPQVWLAFFIILLDGCGGGVITAYSATLINSFGYSPKHTSLLLIGTGPVTLSTTLIGGLGSRYFGQRWAWIILITIPAIIGSCLMAWPPAPKQTTALAGIYLVDAYISLTPIVYQWTVSNVAGHTKRAFAVAMLQAAFAVGNLIGPQTFRKQDAPQYKPAKIFIVAFLSALVCLVATLAAYYRVCNNTGTRKAVNDVADEVVSDAKAYAGLTDKENTSFRYVY